MDTEDRYTRITLRIPKDLHKLLAAEADAGSRSMNAEIVWRLQETFGILYSNNLKERVDGFREELEPLLKDIAESEAACEDVRYRLRRARDEDAPPKVISQLRADYEQAIHHHAQLEVKRQLIIRDLAAMIQVGA